ncbi:glycoside hydrolase [Flammula alnicola]|nr:glycoside hydrolase [Flammula alnicola]
MRTSLIFGLSIFALPTVSQQIWDIWQTTWERSKLFTSLAPSSPINFVTPGPIGSADIVINDGTLYQSIVGFGGSLTDSAALTLNNLKTKNSGNYWNLLQYMFTTTDGANAAGLNYIRVPIGASDFSANLYSLDDTSGDTSFNNFNINNVPSYVFSVLKDIQSTNSLIKIHLLPWSPTMKCSSIDPTYLLKAVQGFQSKGFPIYAISIQNEPQNSNPTYPTCTMSADVEGQIGTTLRNLLNSNGLSSVKIVGYEHNWTTLVLIRYNCAFTGVSFHCYAGSVSNQDQFHNAFPSKAIYFTECAGTIGSDWWSDIKLMVMETPSCLVRTAAAAMGCRPMVTVNSDGSYSFNQEFYSMAQASKAIIPKDAGGPYGQRIGVTVGGSLSWALRVGAYVTGRVSSSDWLRYSIVVLNWDDSASTTWNPQPVTTTIEFRGMQATYTFPVGVTTLWWFAPATGNAASARGVPGFQNATSPDAIKATTYNTTNSVRSNSMRIKV